MCEPFYLVQLITAIPDLSNQVVIVPRTWIKVSGTPQAIKFMVAYPPPPYDSARLAFIGKMCSTSVLPDPKWPVVEAVLQESAGDL